MKNKKTILGSSAAIVAAAALIAGGTFASWSDFVEVQDNSATAGFLELSLDGNQGNAVSAFSVSNLAPGVTNTPQDRKQYIAAADSDPVMQANLFLTLKDLVGVEDGCTTASEAAAGGCSTAEGELPENAHISITATPASTNNAGNRFCSSTSANNTINVFSGTVRALETKGKTLIKEMTTGTDTCLSSRISLPVAPNNNVVQGDSMTFDVRLDLEQKL